MVAVTPSLPIMRRAYAALIVLAAICCMTLSAYHGIVLVTCVFLVFVV